MKVCVVGAGAVGGFLGTRLALAGCTTTAVARGATREALEEHGWRLRTDGRLHQAPVGAVAAPGQSGILGEQDLVVLAVKGPSVREASAAVAPLLGPDTVVMTPMNGVPWWFLDDFGGPLAGTRLASVDPDGVIASAVPTEHVIGCVVHATCSVSEPGLVEHGVGDRLIVGEPRGATSERLRLLADVLATSGFEVATSTSIHADIWYKLWGNLTMNPVSVLTGATCDRILDDPLVEDFCLAVMGEAAEIGSRLGCPIEQSGRDRNDVTRKLGAFKTSMLRDAEAGRPLELDVLLGAAKELAVLTSTATPFLDALLGLTRLSAQVRGVYR
ncbi:2-dehydropantoate 2-reductase [Nocardioides panacihumi]|uniref:2-dehydropantoate 2-reductase n=1 Tax=Nocardioides panacihumi TaxID=400774 RepID=A0ABN2RU77_9ACTN